MTRCFVAFRRSHIIFSIYILQILVRQEFDEILRHISRQIDDAECIFHQVDVYQFHDDIAFLSQVNLICIPVGVEFVSLGVEFG